MTKPILTLIIFLTMICFNLLLIGSVSAANIDIHPSNSYNTTTISLNDQLQKKISSAKNGDTINFLGKYYGNLSLIIDKSLNIISNSNSTVKGDSTGQPIFLIKGSGSRWTNITGFKILSLNDGICINNTQNITISRNTVSSTKGTGIRVTGSSGIKVKNNTVTSSKTGITVTNSKNSNINGNSIKKSTNNGIDVQSSQNVNIYKNNVTSNGKHGVSVSHSKDVAVDSNDIENNGNNGVNLADTNNVNIKNNTISYNKVHGIYFDEYVKNTQITLNHINNNLKYGIELFGSGSSTKINYNLIDRNAIGIDINSATDNLDISQNVITNSLGYDDDSGVGINFGWKFTDSPTFTVNYNAIFGSQRREVCLGDSNTKVTFGYNWYGSGDSTQVRLCPYLTTKWITFKTFESNGVYSAVFYAGDQVASLLSGFEVTFQLNNGTKIKVKVQNGRATASFPSTQYQTKNNILSVTATFQTIKMLLSDDLVQSIIEQLENENKGNNGKGHSGTGGSDINNGGSGPDNSGNGNTPGGTDPEGGSSGSGQSSSPGDNSEQSGGTKTADNSGSSTTLVRNSAILSGAGETSESSSSKSTTQDKPSKTAQEVFLDSANNPNVLSVVGLVLLLVTILLVYYREDIKQIYRK